MSDAFTDLRNCIRRCHDRLKREIRHCKDAEKLKLLKARKSEIWNVWNEFLFEGTTYPVESNEKGRSTPVASPPPSTSN